MSAHDLNDVPDLTDENWDRAQRISVWIATTYRDGIAPTTEDLFGNSRKDGIAIIDLFPMLVKELRKYKE